MDHELLLWERLPEAVNLDPAGIANLDLAQEASEAMAVLEVASQSGLD